MPPTTLAPESGHLVGPGKLKVVNAQLAWHAKDCRPVRLAADQLRELLFYGDVSVSDEAFRLLFQHRIDAAWMSPTGQRCRGRLVAADTGTPIRRIHQYQVLKDGQAEKIELARWVVLAKTDSQFQLARHYQRHGNQAARTTIVRLRPLRESMLVAQTVDQLRGLEGAASQAWFQLFGQLLQRPFQFEKRTRRPPTDPTNALLSFGYTLLSSRVTARINALGLEPNIGALHEYRPGRPSLVCDLVEPLRAPIVDRWVVRLSRSGEVSLDDFQQTPETGCRLTRPALGRVIADWEKWWVSESHRNRLEELTRQFNTELQRLSRTASPALLETYPANLAVTADPDGSTS